MASVRVFVALALVESHGRWLVSRRSEGRLFAGCWEFPGGHMKPDETAWQAAERETLEETGLEVRATGGLGEVAAGTPDGEIVLHLVLCRPVAGTAVPREPAVAEVRWVSLEDLEGLNMPPANAEVVRRIRAYAAGRASAAPGCGQV